MAEQRKKRRLPKAVQTRLMALPHSADFVIEGGVRALDVEVEGAEGGVDQPFIALWLDAGSNGALSAQLIDPTTTRDAGVSEALDALLVALATPASASPVNALDTLDATTGGLLQALTTPADTPPPEALPAVIRVNHAGLAEQARALLEPLAIPVEYVEQLPSFDDAFESLAEFVEAGEEEEPFAWEIDAALLPPLYKAATTLWRRRPWDYMLDHPPLAVALGEHGPNAETPTLYASVLGAAGEVFGVAFYFSAEALHELLAQPMPSLPPAQVEEEDYQLMLGLMRQMGAPVDSAPPDELRAMIGQMLGQVGLAEQQGQEFVKDSLVVFFSGEEESPPSYLEWLAERNLSYPSLDALPSFHRALERAEMREPDERETRALTLAIEALNQFFNKKRTELEQFYVNPPDAPITYTAQVGQGGAKAAKVAIEITFPAPGFTWDPENNPDDAAERAGFGFPLDFAQFGDSAPDEE